MHCSDPERPMPFAGPEVLEAVGSCFSRLTHLRLGTMRFDGSSAEQWAAAVACLPRSLVHLDMGVHSRHGLAEAPNVLAQLQLQAVWFPDLRSVQLLWSGRPERTFQAPAAGTAGTAGAGAVAPSLQHLSLIAAFGSTYFGPFSAALIGTPLGSGLRSLSLSGYENSCVRTEALTQLLGGLPQLHSLSLGSTHLCQGLELWHAICSLQQLHSLELCAGVILGSKYTTVVRWPPIPEDAPPLPGSLTRLRISADSWDKGDLLELLKHVPDRCQLCLPSAKFEMASLRTEDVEAALAHPGGVAMVFGTVDPLTGESAELEVGAVMALVGRQGWGLGGCVGCAPLPATGQDRDGGGLALEGAAASHRPRYI